MIRAIEEKDKEAVLRISKKIWEGEDYVPQVFDEWVQDKKGLFAGYFIEEKLVGFGKITFLTDHDVWLEGLRKDQDCKVKGVGKRLSRYCFDYLKTIPDLHSIRFSTYVYNYESIAINTKMGFQLKEMFSLKCKEIAFEEIKNDQTFDDSISFSEFQEIFAKSEYLEKTNKFIMDGWVVYPASDDYLKLVYDNDSFIVLRNINNEIEGLLVYTKEKYKESFWIKFIHYKNKDILNRLLSISEYLAQNLVKEVIEIVIPEYPELKETLSENGFKSWEEVENDFLIFEYPLDKL